MSVLKDKKITLVVTASISVYKAVDLTSKLRKKGADVIVIMSENAKRFVSPISFQAISGNFVYDDDFLAHPTGMIPHIDLSQKCDMMIVAPASANILGKAANGIADDIVSSSILACTKPLVFVPAMNVDMWEKKATQRNVVQLKEDGAYVMEPEEGLMACGAVGKGRLPEVPNIIEYIESLF